MDTLTHSLFGALVVRAADGRKSAWGGIGARRATLGAAAAAFPDIDYLTFWIDPLSFLADWHRGPTHSLLLAPLWAIALGWSCAWWLRDRANSRGYMGICLLGLLSHIASDLLTSYGTQILAPLSDWRTGFGTTFVIDPYFSAIVLVGVVASIGLGRSLGARAGLAVLALYLGLQVLLQQQAKSIGETYARVERLEQATSRAVAQPLSPFNWLIIVSEGERYHIARVNLAATGGQPPGGASGWLARLWSAYQAPQALNWERQNRFGEPDRVRELVRPVWQSSGFAAFRRFTRYPALYRIDQFEGETCVWFTDLRYRLPGLIPPFRYGMCGAGGIEHWGLYRLRRFTLDERQALEKR
ncbi:metal-dependent hydrolase [Sedimenticola hydrogenitrophicus]|uniref:metal-dependent hydrolase n=1 Tax=Sedimenticola hydrogenitrophicus TaxID=2967975 RepID=UPI0021A96E3E|nr:metal-dependent hydrolase [Sedimenticola hydrogenitrophicus]